MLGPAAGAAPARGGQGCAPSNDAAGGGVALIFLGEEASTESLNPLSMVTRRGEEGRKRTPNRESGKNAPGARPAGRAGQRACAGDQGPRPRDGGGRSQAEASTPCASAPQTFRVLEAASASLSSEKHDSPSPAGQGLGKNFPAVSASLRWFP